MSNQNPPLTYSEGGLTSFTLKIVAIVGMTSNHIGYLFAPYLPFEVECVLLACGGVTFPVMAFLLIEGYRHTSSVRRYAVRLLVFALVAQVPYRLFLASNLNVLFTLLIGLILLYVHDKGFPPSIARCIERFTPRFAREHLLEQGDGDRRMTFYLVLAIGLIASVFCDWGVLGPLMILMGYLMPTRAQRIAYPIILAALSIGLPQASVVMTTGSLSALPYLLYAFIGCPAAIPLLFAYRGRRGLPMKYFFYAYYPLHILIIGIVKVALFGV